MSKNRGFTLIELVVVIAVLGILASIAIPRFLDAQASAKGAKVLGNLRALDSAATIYMAQNSSIPSISDLKKADGKLIDIGDGYKEGIFKIVTNSGKAKEYSDEGNYNIDSKTGRAYLGASSSHTVEYYLSGGSIADHWGDILQSLKDNKNTMYDSGAAINPNSTSAKVVAELRDKYGLDMSELGATTWHYNTSQNTITFSSTDISGMKSGTVKVISYNFKTNTYAVGTAGVEYVANASVGNGAGNQSYSKLSEKTISTSGSYSSYEEAVEAQNK